MGSNSIVCSATTTAWNVSMGIFAPNSLPTPRPRHRSDAPSAVGKLTTIPLNEVLGVIFWRLGITIGLFKVFKRYGID